MQDVTFTAEQMSNIRQKLFGLRYGGMVMYPPSGVLDAESLLRWLQGYSDVMVGVSDRATAQEEELDGLKADLRAAGRVFTLMQPPVPEQPAQAV